MKRTSRQLEAQANSLLKKHSTRRGKKKKKQPTSYAKYMKSRRWKQFKYSYWKKHERVCAACGSTKRLCLHHYSYKKLGNETFDDVVPLCWDCHEELHNEHGSKFDMTEETLDLIETKQLNLLSRNF